MEMDSKPAAKLEHRSPSPFYLGPVEDVEEGDGDQTLIEESGTRENDVSFRRSNSPRARAANVTSRMLGVQSDRSVRTSSSPIIDATSVEAAADGNGGNPASVRRTVSTGALRLRKRRSAFWKKVYVSLGI
jgi:hypothetical protein